MSQGYQTVHGWKASNRKWRSDNSTPIEAQKDWPEFKKIALEFERHTLLCKHCSMFGLRNKHSQKGMCDDGAHIAVCYHVAKQRWMHEQPVAFAQSVVGAVLRGQKEKRKKQRKKMFEQELPRAEAGA